MVEDISQRIVTIASINQSPDASITAKVESLRASMFDSLTADPGSLGFTLASGGIFGTYRILELLYRTPSSADKLLEWQKLDEELCHLFFSLYIELIEDLDKKIINAFQKIADENDLWNVLSKFTDGGYNVLRRFIFYLNSNAIQNNSYIFWLRVRVVAVQGVMIVAGIYTAYYILGATFPQGELIRYISYALLLRVVLFLLLVLEVAAFLNAQSIDFLLGHWFSVRDRATFDKYNAFYELVLQVNSARLSLKSLIVDFNVRANQLGLKSPYGTYITIEEIKLVILLDLSEQQRHELCVLLDLDGLQPFLTDINFVYWVVGDQMRQNGWMIPATLIAVYFTYTGVLTTLLATLIGNNLLTWLSTLGSIIMPIFRAK